MSRKIMQKLGIAVPSSCRTESTICGDYDGNCQGCDIIPHREGEFFEKVFSHGRNEANPRTRLFLDIVMMVSKAEVDLNDRKDIVKAARNILMRY